METTLKEIDLLLNNRSLTFVYENQGNEVLTLNHLIHRCPTNITSSYQSDISDKIVKNVYVHEKNSTEYLLSLKHNYYCNDRNIIH